ncbi:MAG: MFS transporter [Oscillospiraceae bacterium]
MREKNKSLFRLLIPFLFAAFLMYGTFFNSFGANAQTTKAFFAISEGKLGLILTVQAIGCIAISVFLALFGERFNKLRGVTLGLFLMALAGILIGTLPLYCKPGSGYILMLIFSLISGIGFILIDLLMNGVVADIYPEQKNTLLPFVHAFYGMGAMLAPLFVNALINPKLAESFALPYRFLGIGSIIVFVFLLIFGKRVTPKTPYADMELMRARAKENPAEVFRSGKAWLFLLAGVFYLIFQNGLSAWLPSFCSEHLGFDSGTAGIMLTVYFAGALTMRFLSPLVYKKISVAHFYVLSTLISAAVFAVCFLLAPEKPIMLALIALGGLLQGAAVPALIILCCDAFPKRTASASAIVVLAVSIANFIGPVLIGSMIEVFGFVVPMLTATACLLVSVLFIRLATKPAAKN